jgi:hypothetical protein
MDSSRLIDPNARYFLYSTLQKCHDNRIKIYTTALNIGIFVFFIGIIGITLYYCYRKKPTEYELQQKIMRDQQYVLSKIRFYQSENMNRRASDITNLPFIQP